MERGCFRTATNLFNRIKIIPPHPLLVKGGEGFEKAFSA
jgi:hypothetical protein